MKLMLNLRADKRGWKGPAKVEQNEESVYLPRRTTATLPETQEEEDSEVCNPSSVKKNKQKANTSLLFPGFWTFFSHDEKPIYLNMMCEKRGNVAKAQSCLPWTC